MTALDYLRARLRVLEQAARNDHTVVDDRSLKRQGAIAELRDVIVAIEVLS